MILAPAIHFQYRHATIWSSRSIHRIRLPRPAPHRSVSVLAAVAEVAPKSTGNRMTALEGAPDLSKIKAVLFDVDGTLTDSDPLHFKAFRDILVEKGYKGCNNGEPITREFFDEHISGGHNILLGKFLWPEKSQEYRDHFADEKEALFRKYADGLLERVPGLTEWMVWIDSRGLKKCAVTNAPKLNAEAMLKALEMDTWFDRVVLGENCKNPKPFPDPYLEGLSTFAGVQPDEALVCEDSPSGTAAGVAAKIPVCAVLTSQTKERMTEAGAKIIIKDYHELVAMAKKACGEA